MNQGAKNSTGTESGSQPMKFFSFDFMLMYVPIILMMICVTSSYTSLRIVKDTFVMKYTGSGALKILKTSGVLIAVLMFNALYAAAFRFFRKRGQFALYSVMASFLVIYSLFVLACPYTERLQYPELGEVLMAKLPKYLSFLSVFVEYIGVLFGYWVVALFYCTVEVYGLAVLTMVVWVFANTLIPVHLKMTSGFLMSGISNLFTIFATENVKGLSGLNGRTFDQRVSELVLELGVAPLALMLVFGIYLGQSYSHAFVSDDSKDGKKSKSSGSLISNMIETFRDPYTSKIAIMVLCYNFLISASDLVSKAAFNTYYPNLYANIAVTIAQVNAFFATILSLIAASIFSGFSWRVKALFPAVCLGFPGIGFYIFYIFRDNHIVQVIASTIRLSPGASVVLLGAMLSVLGKGSKYSGFDQVKEFALSLGDKFTQIYAKAFIDTTLNRFSKSFPSYLMVIMVGFGSFFSPTPQVQNLSTSTTTAHHAHHGHHSHAQSSTSDSSQVKTETTKLTKDEVSKAKKMKEIAETNMTAPYMMVVFIIVTCLWLYAVLALAPQCERRAYERRMTEKGLPIDEAEIKKGYTTLPSLSDIGAVAGLCISFLFATGITFRIVLNYVFSSSGGPNSPQAANLSWEYIRTTCMEFVSIFVINNKNAIAFTLISLTILIIGLWILVGFSFPGDMLKVNTRKKVKTSHIVGLAAASVIVLGGIKVYTDIVLI